MPGGAQECINPRPSGRGGRADMRVVRFQNGEDSMSLLTRSVVRFLRDEDGPTAVEYAVMLALIIVVCVAAIAVLGSNANNTYKYVGSKAGPTGS
jgi:pilus assembly protein Flp/PilA